MTPTSPDNELGAMISRERLALDLTQEDFAQRYDVSGPAIFNFETGYVRPSLNLWLRIVGRTSDVISVGGIKVLPEEIERAAYLHPGVLHASAYGVHNPITGQHIELICEPKPGAQLDRKALREHMQQHVPSALMPHRIKVGAVEISYRFKRR